VIIEPKSGTEILLLTPFHKEFHYCSSLAALEWSNPHSVTLFPTVSLTTPLTYIRPTTNNPSLRSATHQPRSGNTQDLLRVARDQPTPPVAISPRHRNLLPLIFRAYLRLWAAPPEKALSTPHPKTPPSNQHLMYVHLPTTNVLSTERKKRCKSYPYKPTFSFSGPQSARPHLPLSTLTLAPFFRLPSGTFVVQQRTDRGRKSYTSYSTRKAASRASREQGSGNPEGKRIVGPDSVDGYRTGDGERRGAGRGGEKALHLGWVGRSVLGKDCIK